MHTFLVTKRAMELNLAHNALVYATSLPCLRPCEVKNGQEQ